MESDFYSVYECRMNAKYRTHISTKYFPFLQTLSKYLPRVGGKIAEFGCGAGNISRALTLQKPGVAHVLVDQDPRMLRLSSINLSSVTSRFELKEWNILYPLPITGIDLIHSHGVLEHFQDEQIVRIIENQLLICPRLVHYVPGAKYQIPSFGDERLLTVDQWKGICAPDEILEFNEGYDLILIWDRT